MIDSADARAATQPEGGTLAAATTSKGRTAVLLAAGVVAGPLYVVVSLAQALTRPGFDLSRHPWSALANGDLGWIQMVNLILTGIHGDRLQRRLASRCWPPAGQQHLGTPPDRCLRREPGRRRDVPC